MLQYGIEAIARACERIDDADGSVSGGPSYDLRNIASYPISLGLQMLSPDPDLGLKPLRPICSPQALQCRLLNRHRSANRPSPVSLKTWPRWREGGSGTSLGISGLMKPRGAGNEIVICRLCNWAA